MALYSPAKNDFIDVNPNVDLDRFTLQDLLKLRADIDRRLPAQNLRDLNLERELVLQFLASQELQNIVMKDDETPANQKAQVANATANILQQLGKLQLEIHNSERLKRIEHVLIECLNNLPKDQQAAFLDVYTEALGADFRRD